MTHLLSTFLLSASANIDTFAVAIACGVKKLRIGIFSNLLIAVVSTGGTVLSMSVGTVISRYLSDPVGNFLGSGVLVTIGLWGIWDTLKREQKRTRAKNRQKQTTRSLVAAGIYNSEFFQTESLTEPAVHSSTELLDSFSYECFLENPDKADKDCSGYIDVMESTFLAFGLTINNLGSGIGAGISGLNISLTVVLTFSFSILAIVVGYFLGHRLTAKMTGSRTGILYSSTIIALGIYEYFIW